MTKRNITLENGVVIRRKAPMGAKLTECVTGEGWYPCTDGGHAYVRYYQTRCGAWSNAVVGYLPPGVAVPQHHIPELDPW